MPEIQIAIHKIESVEELSVFIALFQGRECGKLIYTEEEGSIILQKIRSDIKRAGIGRKLISALVASYPGYTPVHSTIIHEETLGNLRQGGFFEEIESKELIIIDNPDLLATLPIVRFLQSGGIQTAALEISPDPYDPLLKACPIRVSSRGYTLKP